MDSHTRLARSRSHNGPTNPRNKPKLKVTQKRNSRSKGLKQSAQPRQTVSVEAADYQRGPGGPSASIGRTVQKCHPNFQYCTSKNGSSVPYSRTVRGQLALHELSATSRSVYKHCATKINFPDGSNHEHTRTSGELDERRPHGLSAPTRRTVARCGQSSSILKTRSQPFLSIHGSPKQLEILR
jgi:hypothetical protein